jgi:hypothetical protein
VCLYTGGREGEELSITNGRYWLEIYRCKERAKLEKLGGNCKGRFFICEILQKVGLGMLEFYWGGGGFKEK